MGIPECSLFLAKLHISRKEGGEKRKNASKQRKKASKEMGKKWKRKQDNEERRAVRELSVVTLITSLSSAPTHKWSSRGTDCGNTGNNIPPLAAPSLWVWALGTIHIQLVSFSCPCKDVKHTLLTSTHTQREREKGTFTLTDLQTYKDRPSKHWYWSHSLEPAVIRSKSWKAQLLRASSGQKAFWGCIRRWFKSTTPHLSSGFYLSAAIWLRESSYWIRS